MLRRLLLFLFLVLFLAFARAADPLAIDRTTKRLNEPTIKLPSGSTLTLESGSIFDFSGATVTLPSNVVTLTGSQALTNKTVNGLTLTSSTGTITIANGKTLTASNTLTLAGTDGSTLNVGTGSDLSALATNSTNGLWAAGTNVARTITGTAGDIVVTNGNGVSGNPTIASDVTGVSANSYDRVTVNTKGKVTSGENVPWFYATSNNSTTYGDQSVGVGLAFDWWNQVAGGGTLTAGQSWTAPKTGWYYADVVLAGAFYQDQGQVKLEVSGTSGSSYILSDSQNGTFQRFQNARGVFYMTAGDTVLVSYVAYTGSPPASFGATDLSRWFMRWLGN